MLSLGKAPFQNHSPFDHHYMTSRQEIFLHGLRGLEQERRNCATLAMPLKTWSLDAIPEALLPVESAGMGMRVSSNKKAQASLDNAGGSPSGSCRAMNRKFSQVTPLRAEICHGAANEISSFDLEYALLEHALRKDASPLNSTRVTEDGRSRKCVSPPLLEPDFYFGDILGDEAIPPQPLTNVTKEEEKQQDDEEEHLEEVQNFANYQHIEALSGNDQISNENGYRIDELEHADTDLSTALASLVNSHVSGESLSPTHLSSGNEHFMPRADGLEDRSPILTKRRAADSTAERPSKFSRVGRNSGWSPGIARNHEGFHSMESNKRLQTVTLGGHQEGQATGCNRSTLDGVFEEAEAVIHSPVSDSSMSRPGIKRPGIRSHPDLYENLSDEIRVKVDRLRKKISGMPRRKLRESLAQGVTLEDVEPLMCLNRDELAVMLGLGVTTLKMFVHNTLGVPRWPARALKSQQVKMQKLVQKKMEAERKGDQELAKRVQRDLTKMQMQLEMRRRKIDDQDSKIGVREGGGRKKQRL